MWVLVCRSCLSCVWSLFAKYGMVCVIVGERCPLAFCWWPAFCCARLHGVDWCPTFSVVAVVGRCWVCVVGHGYTMVVDGCLLMVGVGWRALSVVGCVVVCCLMVGCWRWVGVAR